MALEGRKGRVDTTSLLLKRRSPLELRKERGVPRIRDGSQDFEGETNN